MNRGGCASDRVSVRRWQKLHMPEQEEDEWCYKEKINEAIKYKCFHQGGEMKTDRKAAQHLPEVIGAGSY